MKHIGLIFVFTLLAFSAVQAQDTPVVDRYPSILLCEDGQGCRHSPISGALSYDDARLALGEPPIDGARALICTEGGCDWASVSDQDIDLVFGGDGTPDGMKAMTFDEDEVEPEGFDFSEEEAQDEAEEFDFSEDEVEDGPRGFDFSEDELGVHDVVPKAGSWTAVHEAATLNCPGVFSMDIPAGDPQDATITVAEDGSSFSATDLDPDTPQMDMQRVRPGYYHAELPIETGEGSMVLKYDVGFFDPALAVGTITGEMTTQGYDCTIERGVLIVHESLDLFSETDDPAEESTADGVS